MTAVIRNREEEVTGPNSPPSSRGYAPDAEIYSAELFSQDYLDNNPDAPAGVTRFSGLEWALIEKKVTLVNQSFSAVQDSFTSACKDFLGTRWPWPLFVASAGNWAPDSYEYQKDIPSILEAPIQNSSFNHLCIGNYDHENGTVFHESLFVNPDDLDRELPDLCAPGTNMTMMGHTGSGAALFDPSLGKAGDGGPSPLRGWDVGSTDYFEFKPPVRRFTGREYKVVAPAFATGPQSLRVALAWSHPVVQTDYGDHVGHSYLKHDLDIRVFRVADNGRLKQVGSSLSWSNTYEIADVPVEPGKTYIIKIHHYGVTGFYTSFEKPEASYGIAWDVRQPAAGASGEPSDKPHALK